MKHQIIASQSLLLSSLLFVASRHSCTTPLPLPRPIAVSRCTRKMTEHAQPDSTPRYLRHTFSSKSSGSSQHAEIERVANSFRSSNFLSLHALPASLRPGGIEESRRTRISSGRSSKPEHIHRVKTNKEYFSPITYSRDEYMKVAADDKMEQQHKQLTSLSFSRKPFTYATSRIRLKNEDIFGDEKYKFPVLGVSLSMHKLYCLYNMYNDHFNEL